MSQLDYNSPEYAAKVETDLRALQDKHRLAIHQWENLSRYDWPGELVDALKIAPEKLDEQLINDPAHPQFSMSLLPSTAAKKSIVPFDISDQWVPDPGYLFSLDQQISHPARVMRVSRLNLDSGEGIRRKSLRLAYRHVNSVPGLEHFYDPYFRNGVSYDEELKRDVVNNPEMSATQLDALGRHIDSYFEPGTTMPLNEIIVAACQQHVAAISIPVHDQKIAETNPLLSAMFFNMTSKQRQAAREFTAAITGLQHLDQGIDLPVVFYHVTEPHLGQITYFARGRQMLMEKAVAAIGALQKDHLFDPSQPKRIWSQQVAPLAKEMLGIDIYRPVEEQKPVQQIAQPEHKGKLNWAKVFNATAAAYGAPFYDL